MPLKLDHSKRNLVTISFQGSRQNKNVFLSDDLEIPNRPNFVTQDNFESSRFFLFFLFARKLVQISNSNLLANLNSRKDTLSIYANLRRLPGPSSNYWLNRIGGAPFDSRQTLDKCVAHVRAPDQIYLLFSCRLKADGFILSCLRAEICLLNIRMFHIGNWKL